ncbi:MAG: hypothetical protein JNM61_00250 [Zoogloeaceae bacterium]|nr:hypothetical protein [Zoogloeaceae bacterium]
MKIHHLPMGTRFEWKGEVYTKIGPMTGANERGGSVFIPKYAILRPVDGPQVAPPAVAVTTLDTQRVLTAFEAYHASASALLDAPGRTALEAARTQFLAALNETHA